MSDRNNDRNRRTEALADTLHAVIASVEIDSADAELRRTGINRSLWNVPARLHIARDFAFALAKVTNAMELDDQDFARLLEAHEERLSDDKIEEQVLRFRQDPEIWEDDFDPSVLDAICAMHELHHPFEPPAETVAAYRREQRYVRALIERPDLKLRIEAIYREKMRTILAAEKARRVAFERSGLRRRDVQSDSPQ